MWLPVLALHVGVFGLSVVLLLMGVVAHSRVLGQLAIVCWIGSLAAPMLGFLLGSWTDSGAAFLLGYVGGWVLAVVTARWWGLPVRALRARRQEAPALTAGALPDPAPPPPGASVP